MNIVLSEADYRYHDDNYLGFCIKCGGVHDCCEPDARKYNCADCETNTVYGTAELLMMGKLEIE